MKRFCKSLREQAMKISMFKKKKYHQFRDHCHYSEEYRGVAHNICDLKYNEPKEIPIIFHNGSNYDYHIIMKELVEESDGGNTKKHIAIQLYEWIKKI